MPDSLQCRRLQSEVRQMLSEGFVGGSGRLFRLEQLAWDCHRTSDGSAKIIWAGIAQFLDQIARRQQEEAVLAEEAVRLCDRVSQPLLRCLDALAGKESGVSAENLVGDLTASYTAWLHG